MALSRRTLLGLAAAVPVSAALAACSGSSGPGKGGAATYWYLNGQPQEGVRAGAVDAFNKANPDTQIEDTTYQNDAYKTKIKTAIGAGQAPTVIWGWGGGTLRAYAEAGQVEDLTPWFDENPDVKKGLFPSSFGAATVDGKIYAMPCETVQPIILYYNKRVFDRVKVDPPESWDDIMALVPKFNAKGIAPFALGGQSRWTNMMWLEFLFDRIGGPEVFQAAIEGEKNAWSHPDAIKALTALQDLVKADGFVKGFSSITADSNADQALLYTDRAAMMLHGAWSYGIQQADGGDFVSSDSLGFMNFPAVEGGKGDLSNTVGNPAQYLSISAKASAEQKKIAKDFFATGILQEEEVKQWIGNGSVPIRLGTEKLLAEADNAEFLQFTYDVASKAKVFVQSWDQALSPTAAETLLDNIVKLFQLSISPQQFASNLNAVTAA
ncbi:extracellular solute-binding protein [Streptomyces althioticus]|jgi:raffinose/stachyose/melibiose transport system substrate-binding protein|uniref:Sugar ABC transporter substrate-binding protein n=1 Tax=Streptomyces griseorubens TaxID=66897 RepID=A0ABR4T9U8_9ACTN|nr:extracellular solute-binding protein [Streptomyces griseorubens]ALV48480.1 sugar ABC transporter substrate-binding protein [Streptomyces sp. 4F]MCC9684327.1 extracellular solute-binding protein [Streptomyces sp. MNU103]WTC26994.1 extracellular solute-binding protein [Streptomyces althioticus]GGT35372.1 solute-binding protein [Streptomyces matensis]KEG44136.1 sugar ABC transporter substrate-binding protein [Streptomyces griseorubens]